MDNDHIASLCILLRFGYSISCFNEKIKEVKIIILLTFLNRNLIPHLENTKIPSTNRKTLNVRKIGEMKKTRSNRNLFCSPALGSNNPRKKGLLFPRLQKPQSESCCKSDKSPSILEDDSVSEKSSSVASPGKRSQEVHLDDINRKAYAIKSSIDIVKLDTSSDTGSDSPSILSNKGRSFINLTLQKPLSRLVWMYRS